METLESTFSLKTNLNFVMTKNFLSCKLFLLDPKVKTELGGKRALIFVAFLY